MSMLMAAVLALGANDEYDLDLATALARRGWVELAEQVCGRIDPKQSGLPLVLAEVSFAKARREADVRRAAKELDVAMERLTRAGPRPDARRAGDDGLAPRPEVEDPHPGGGGRCGAPAGGDEVVGGHGGLLPRLAGGAREQTSSRAVDEALLDAKLEIPKALASQARVPAIDEARRTKLLLEAIGLFSDFMFGISNQPVKPGGGPRGGPLPART
jgi:hypothetical protein